MREYSEPVVSVIIPAYRASADIADALTSVFEQSFSHFEVVVVDDGSPDGEALRAAVAPFRSRIRYIEQANRGAGAARNTAIRASRGRYLAFLDADDRWARDFLRRQIWYLDANPSCALVYCDAVLTGDTPLAGSRFMETAPSSGEVTLLALIEQRCNVILSTVVARRDAIVAAGLFDESIRRGQDFELWLRLARRSARIAYQRHVLAERFVRADGLSGTAAAELERAIDVLDRFGRAQDLPAAARTALRIRIMQLVDRLEVERGKQRLLEGNFAAARFHLEAARGRTLKVRLASIALQIAPRLTRALYLRMRPSATDASVRPAADCRLGLPTAD